VDELSGIGELLPSEKGWGGGLKRVVKWLFTTAVLAVPLVLLVRAIFALDPGFASEREPICIGEATAGCAVQVLAPASRQNGVYIMTTVPSQHAADLLAMYLAAAGLAGFILSLGRLAITEDEQRSSRIFTVFGGIVGAVVGALAALGQYNQGKPELWVLPFCILLGFWALWPVLSVLARLDERSARRRARSFERRRARRR
jgi:hypothetical protein